MYPQNSQFQYGPSWAGSDGAAGAFGAAGMMGARRRRATQYGQDNTAGGGGGGFLAGLDIGGRRRKHMEATFDRIGKFAELEHKLNQGTMTTAAGLEKGLQDNKTANKVTKIGAKSTASINETKAQASADVRRTNAAGKNQRAGVTNAALATNAASSRTTGLKLGADGGAEMSFNSPAAPAKPRATAKPATTKPGTSAKPARAPKPTK